MFTCPRRVEDGTDQDDSPLVMSGANKDEYRPPDNTCTYCGSFNPDTLMQRLEAGDVELGPTDKSYKVYVRNMGGENFKQTHRDDDKPFAGHGNPVHNWITRETDQTKFYFQHLSVEQKKRFVELLNEKKLKIGYPGHFYVSPFFISK